MKILHVIPSIAPVRGGPSKAVIEMVKALRSRGIDAEIATTNDDGPNLLAVPLNSLSEYNGVPVRFFQRFSPPIGPLREFAFSVSFKDWLNKNIARYDAIHIHAIFSFTSSYAMYLARKTGTPYVVRPIGQLERWSLNQSKRRKQFFLSLFERRNLANASALHFTAESEKTQALLALPELAQSLAEVIPLGIPPSPKIASANAQLIQRYQLSETKKTLLYLSRLHPKKGLELLFEALSQVDTNAWQLIIAGDGEADYVEKLRQMTLDTGLNSQCHFIGFQSGQEKELLLQGADLYVLTSHSENFGIAVLEALAAGTPALVSREVALSQAIAEAKIGFVCDLSVASISATLKSYLNGQGTVINDPAVYTYENYSWNAIASQLQDTYTKIST